MKPKVLLVDDEPNVLSGYVRALRKRYDITTATRGGEALELSAAEGPFAVAVSDMRMPEMNGVEFLSRLKRQAPDTVRIMLTGNADQETAVAAVNEGDVFMFLNKPCPVDAMAEALSRGAERYQFARAERDLLENTLRGSVEALSEVLALSNPAVFGRTARFRKLMAACLAALGVEQDWVFETLPMVCLLGTVALSDAITRKALSGAPLSHEEQAEFNRHPEWGSKLLGKIPRLEPLAEAVRFQLENMDGSGVPGSGPRGHEIPLGSRLLRVVMHYDVLSERGVEPGAALAELESQPHCFDPDIVAALKRVLDRSAAREVHKVSVYQLADHMRLVQDVTTDSGALLVCKDQQLSESVIARLINFFKNGSIPEYVYVDANPQQASAHG